MCYRFSEILPHFTINFSIESMEEAEEAQFMNIDGCYQYPNCGGHSFSRVVIAVKSACCELFSGQSYRLLADGSCHNW